MIHVIPKYFTVNNEIVLVGESLLGSVDPADVWPTVFHAGVTEPQDIPIDLGVIWQ